MWNTQTKRLHILFTCKKLSFWSEFRIWEVSVKNVDSRVLRLVNFSPGQLIVSSHAVVVSLFFCELKNIKIRPHQFVKFLSSIKPILTA